MGLREYNINQMILFEKYHLIGRADFVQICSILSRYRELAEGEFLQVAERELQDYLTRN